VERWHGLCRSAEGFIGKTEFPDNSLPRNIFS
jgi:hypothetical protein